MRRTLAVAITLLIAVPAVAGDKPLPADLAVVPHDAAVFIHVDVAKLWTSKVGDTFRKTDARDITVALKQFTDGTGLTLADVKTFTLLIPKVKADGPPPLAMILRTLKPYDRTRTMLYIKQQSEKEKESVVAKGDAKLLVGKDVLFDCSEPTAIKILTRMGDKDRLAPATSTGPLTAAINAAAAGKPAVLAVGFGSMPDEIRGDNLPAAFAPFKPLLLSDAAIGVADFVQDDLVVEVRFACGTQGKALEAEKSIGAMRTLLSLALGGGVMEMKKGMEMKKDKEMAKLADLGDVAAKVVEKAVIANDGTTASVRLSVPADTNYAPFVESIFGKVGGAAARNRSQNNLKQLGLAMHNYAATYQDALPPAAILGKKGKPQLSWRVSILPYIEQEALYKKFKLDEAWDSPHNKKVFDENPMPVVFLLPGTEADAGKKKTHYQGFVGNGALFDLVQSTPFRSIADGTSNTVLLTVAKTPVEWTKPDDINFDPNADPREKLLMADNGINVLFADGSVRFVIKDLAADKWKAFITKAGGEVIGD